MKPEDKELLFKDLSGRLPYHVRCKIWLTKYGTTEEGPLDLEHNYGDVLQDAFFYRDRIKDIKPWLRPLSSMTEEEARDIAILHGYNPEEILSIKVTDEYIDIILDNCDCSTITSTIWYNKIVSSIECFDYLNRNMFDIRGLIPKGLAEIAPEGMYELKLLDNYLPSQNESDSVIDNATKITVGCKIRSKTNPNEILSIISDDCHGDEFECANGDVLSLKQIEKYYELIK